MTTNSEDNSVSVDSLVDQFLQGFRHGETPSIEEYCDRYPALADEIREVFEAVLMVENLKPGSTDESLPINTSSIRLDLETVGEYKILSVIGRGGMGIVYEAEQPSLGRRVALKVLPSGAGSDTRRLERFQREARAAARMHHTNIVPVFDVGEDEEHVYYAMQLIRGQSLDLVIEELRRLQESTHDTKERTCIASHADLPMVAESVYSGNFTDLQFDESDLELQPRTAYQDTSVNSSTRRDSTSLGGSGKTRDYHRTIARLGVQAADALSYAHERGVIHRDIKPANLLVDETGVLWVTDFGLAKTEDSNLTRTGEVLGTVRYMAPEQFQGKGDRRADIYSLGLTLYEMVTFRPAFTESNRGSLIQQITRGAPPLRAIEKSVPRDLETIILKSVDKEPKRRYQNAAAFRDDLQRFVDDKPIQARRITPPERFIRWSRQNKSLSGALCAVVTLVVFIVISSMLSATHERERREELANQYFGRRISDIGRRIRESGASIETLQQLNAAADGVNEQSFAVRYLLGIGLHENRTVQLPRAATQIANRDGKVVLFAPEIIRTGRTRAKHNVSRFDVYVWDPTSNQLEHIIEDKSAHYDVALSHDGCWLAINSDYQIGMLNLQSGIEEWAVDFSPEGVQSMTFSRDGRWLTTRSRGEIRVLDVVTGAESLKTTVAEWNEDELGNLRFWETAPDGNAAVLLDYPHNGGVVVRDLSKSVNTFSPCDRIMQHWRSRPTVHVAAFSSNNKYCAWADHSGTVHVWNRISEEQFLLPDGAPQIPICMSFSDDGNLVAIGDKKGYVTVWDVKGRALIRRSRTHSSKVNSLCFAANDSLLVTTDSDGALKQFELRNSIAKTELYREPSRRVLRTSISADSSSIAFVDGRSLFQCRKTDGHWQRQELVSDVRSSLSTVCYSQTDPEIAIGRSSGIELFQQQPFELVHRLDVPDEQRPGVWKNEIESTVCSIDYSPDGSWIAAGYGSPTIEVHPGAEHDQIVGVWNRKTGTIAKVITGFKNATRGVAFSPDGSSLCVACIDGTVRIFNVGSWDERKRIHEPKSQFWSLAYSPKGQYLAVGDSEGVITLRDAQSAQALVRLTGHSRGVSALTFTSSERTLASGSWDGSVRLWDMRAKDELMLLDSERGFVRDVKFDSKDESLSVVSQDEGESVVTLHQAVPIEKMNDDIFDSPTSKVTIAKAIPNKKEIRTDKTTPVAPISTNKEFDHAKSAFNHRPNTNDVIRPPIRPLWLPGKFNPIYTNDGNLLLAIGRGSHRSAAAKSIFGWQLATGNIVRQWKAEKPLTRIAVSKNFNLLAAGDANGGVRMFDYESGKQLWTIESNADETYNPVYGLEFSNSVDGLIAASRRDGQLSVHSVANGKLAYTFPASSSRHKQLNFSLTGRWLVCGSPCILLDAKSGDVVATFPAGTETPAFVSSDRLIATSNSNGSVTIWDWDGETLSEKTILNSGETGGIGLIELSPDGKRMLTVHEDLGCSFFIWDTATWQVIASSRTKYFHDAAFHPANSQLALECGFGTRFFDYTKRKAITVDQALLDAYQGTYQRSSPGPTQYYQVEREGNHLRIKSGAGRWRKWWPLSDTTFFTKEKDVIPDTYGFIRTKENRATHIVLQYNSGFLATQPRVPD